MLKCVSELCTVYMLYPDISISLSLSLSVSISPPGAQHPGGHGLCCGPSPLRRLPGPPAAVQGLEARVEHPGDQHRGVPPPETSPLPQGLHPQQHHGEDTNKHTHTHYILIILSVGRHQSLKVLEKVFESWIKNLKKLKIVSVAST